MEMIDVIDLREKPLNDIPHIIKDMCGIVVLPDNYPLGNMLSKRLQTFRGNTLCFAAVGGCKFIGGFYIIDDDYVSYKPTDEYENHADLGLLIRYIHIHNPNEIIVHYDMNVWSLATRVDYDGSIIYYIVDNLDWSDVGGYDAGCDSHILPILDTNLIVLNTTNAAEQALF